MSSATLAPRAGNHVHALNGARNACYSGQPKLSTGIHSDPELPSNVSCESSKWLEDKRWLTIVTILMVAGTRYMVVTDAKSAAINCDISSSNVDSANYALAGGAAVIGFRILGGSLPVTGQHQHSSFGTPNHEVSKSYSLVP